MNLTLNCYTQWYWKIDLHNLLHFLALRSDAHAQYEIREYAKIMLDLVQKWVPNSCEAFIKNRINAKEFSGSAIEVIKRMINGEKVDQENTNLSLREWDELMSTLEIKN